MLGDRNTFGLLFELPIEVSFHVFSFLSCGELCRVATVSKFFHSISKSDILWKDLGRREFPELLSFCEPNERWQNFYKRVNALNANNFYKTKTSFPEKSLEESETFRQLSFEIQWKSLVLPKATQPVEWTSLVTSQGQEDEETLTSGNVARWIPPHRRVGYSSTLVGNCLYVIGGEYCSENHRSIYNDVHVYNRSTEQWEPLELNGGEFFPPTSFHSATLVNNQIYVLGNSCFRDDRPHHLVNHHQCEARYQGSISPGQSTMQVFVLDLDKKQWMKPKSFGKVPPWIFRHQCIIVDNYKLFVFQGQVISVASLSSSPNLSSATASWISLQPNNHFYVLDTRTMMWSSFHTTNMGSKYLICTSVAKKVFILEDLLYLNTFNTVNMQYENSRVTLTYSVQSPTIWRRPQIHRSELDRVKSIGFQYGQNLIFVLPTEIFGFFLFKEPWWMKSNYHGSFSSPPPSKRMRIEPPPRGNNDSNYDHEYNKDISQFCSGQS